MSLSVENVFCLDNEAFRYLVLQKNLSPAESDYYEETRAHQTFVYSWEVSKEASKKLVSKARSLPVLDMKEVVNYNQSRTMSFDLVEKIVHVFVKLGRVYMHANEVLKNDLDKPLFKIIELSASITKHLSSKAVTIFNDHLDAHLEETAKALLASSIEGDSKVGTFLELIRSKYLEDRTNASEVILVDMKIYELQQILDEKLSSNIRNTPTFISSFLSVLFNSFLRFWFLEQYQSNQKPKITGVTQMQI